MRRGRTPGDLLIELFDRVVRGAGVSPPALRQAAFGTGADGLPTAAAPVIDKIRRHAYKVTDEDIAALRAAGMDEDTIYELTIAAASGVAQRRFAASRTAMDSADATSTTEAAS